MNTTIIITGHLRTFDRCLGSQHWQVFRHLPNPRFVLSCVAGDDHERAAAALRRLYPAAQVDSEAVEQPEIPEPAGRPQDHAPYAISVPVQAVLRQLWHLERGYKFAIETGGIGRHVVRIRPDLHFQGRALQTLTTERRGILNVYQTWCDEMECLVPWWGCFGGVNDRFAVMGGDASKHYFGTFSAIPSLLAAGCPLHPESLVAAALEAGGVSVAPFYAMFGTLRESGEIRHPEILTHELAEYARNR